MKSYRSLSDELLEVKIEVPLGAQGMRLDRFLVRYIPRLSRTRVQSIIARGVHDQTGKAAKASRAVRVGETYIWHRPVESEPDRDLHINVVYEDERFLVLNKPANVVVHPTARVWKHTVTAWLNEHKPGAKIAHRLDRETSGVLVCGKGKWAAWLKERFRDSDVRKTYLALTKQRVAFEVTRSDAALKLDAESDLSVKMCVDEQNGLPSTTEFFLRAHLGNYSLVECQPLTGRQHQIRVHLWHMGTPILGDKLYGVSDDIFRQSADAGNTEEVLAATGAARHMLHAARLRLALSEHEVLEFSAPLPEDFLVTAGCDPAMASLDLEAQLQSLETTTAGVHWQRRLNSRLTSRASRRNIS